MDTAHDLVVDGSGPRGKVFETNDLIAIFTDECHHGSNLDTFDMSHIDHEHIHADTTPNRRTTTIDQDMGDVGQAAIVTLKIAYR